MAGLHKEITIRISYDEMEAYLLLARPGEGETYSKSEIMAALREKKVKIGVDESIIERMLSEERFGREVLIARGTAPVDGKDGYFTYNFDLNLNNKPTVREDGSVDYWSIHAVETVEEGQVIATYTEPIDGHHGMSVTGKLVMAKRGRPLPPLTGKGFERSADNKTYTASIAGKIEMCDSRVTILPVYEISGDVDLATGNIDFRGDVIIHGNVTSGACIHATGSVTVDGIAEGCTIDAGKDVILRSGFLGGYKGVLKSKGNVIAKFIEYAKVEAEGSIDLTSALNCTITGYDKVFINGKTANVVGGVIYGAGGVEAYSLGTAAEVKTVIKAGASRELIGQMTEASNRITEATEMIDKINIGLQQLDEMAAEKGIDLQKDERRISLLRARIAKQAELAKGKEEMGRLEAIYERCKSARIRVFRTVYPGVSIEINGYMNNMKEDHAAIEFRERQGNIIMMDISDAVVC